jgi:hypothetical protein
MATSERDISDQSESRKIIIIVAIIAAIVIAGLFYLLMRTGRGPGAPPPHLEAAIRLGAPDWDRYSKYVVRDEPYADESKRALGDIVMTLHTTVRNFTGKTITGLEVWGAVVNHQDQPIKQRTLVAIPGANIAELAPNKTVEVQIMLDGLSDSDDRANIKMEITGFKIR